GASNRRLIRNAIAHLCLAGPHVEEQKARCLEVLDAHPAPSFVVLLAQNKSLSFRGLYALWPERAASAQRIFGVGPASLSAEAPPAAAAAAAAALRFFKYNSAAREFREVHSRSFGGATDAVSMEPQ
ncbi:CKK domain-containing protein, partial [Tribonema minus]